MVPNNYWSYQRETINFIEVGCPATKFAKQKIIIGFESFLPISFFRVFPALKFLCASIVCQPKSEDATKDMT